MSGVFEVYKLAVVRESGRAVRDIDTYMSVGTSEPLTVTFNGGWLIIKAVGKIMRNTTTMDCHTVVIPAHQVFRVEILK